MPARTPASVIAFLLVALAAQTVQAQQPVDRILRDSFSEYRLDSMLSQLAVAKIEVAPGTMDVKDLRFASRIVEAANQIDLVFRQQVSELGAEWYQYLRIDPRGKAAKLLQMLDVHYGPWNRLAEDSPYMGVGEKPKGAAFYPPDASSYEIDRFLRENPEKAGALMSPYTVVRRSGRDLVAVPYSEKYRMELKKASGALREASTFTEDKALKDFLVARADALLNDNYYPSEILWMDTEKSPWVVVIGPYEYYEDRLFGAKASFEAILSRKDEAETKRFLQLRQKLEELVKNLPIPAEQKVRLKIQSDGDVTIANEVYAAGEARAGGMATAFSLPNDPRVRQERGSRQVILKNVAQAKFDKSWLPLSRYVLADEQAGKVDFESYFNLLLATQMSNVLVMEGDEDKVARGLKQRRQVIEETKTDALGLLLLLEMAEYGLVPELTEGGAAATYLVSAFRVMRLDPGGTHGLAKTASYNFLASRGAFIYDPASRRYQILLDALGPAVEALAAEILDIWLNGDYARAGAFIMEYGLLSQDVRSSLDSMRDLPADIRADYPILDLLKLR